MTEKIDLDVPALKKQFERDGYLLLRNVLPKDKTEQLNEVDTRIIAEEPEALSYNIYHCVKRDSALLDLIDEPTLLPLVVNILGYNIQLHISHLTVRKPNPMDRKTETGSFIHWHQDGPHPEFPMINGLTSMYYLKICYILSDMSEPNRGNTKIIPGSHRIPNFKPNQRDVNVPNEHELQICGKPGDAFLFAQNLWHAGAPNRSTYNRRQLFIGYSPVWMRPIDYHKAAPELLDGADPIRRQLLGEISPNFFKYYVPEEKMVPLKSLWIGDSGKSIYTDG